MNDLDEEDTDYQQIVRVGKCMGTHECTGSWPGQVSPCSSLPMLDTRQYLSDHSMSATVSGSQAGGDESEWRGPPRQFQLSVMLCLSCSQH